MKTKEHAARTNSYLQHQVLTFENQSVKQKQANNQRTCISFDRQGRGSGCKDCVIACLVAHIAVGTCSQDQTILAFNKNRKLQRPEVIKTSLKQLFQKFNRYRSIWRFATQEFCVGWKFLPAPVLQISNSSCAPRNLRNLTRFCPTNFEPAPADFQPTSTPRTFPPCARPHCLRPALVTVCL